MAVSYYAMLERRGLPHASPFKATTESGKYPSPFNLTSAIYHVSGASSFTFECPHGLQSNKACKVHLDDILDIQLALYEAMMRHELAKKE